jgi:glycosyltransferase involved in cell wall biosynthesis
MNLLMFNLAVDNKHVTLAFGIRWIEALAARFDHVDVVTMTAGEHQLPANVTVWSVGRERGYPKWFRVLRFYWLVWRILRRKRIDVVFTHMIPVFAVLFWPISLVTGLKNVLWYAHGATPTTLKLAHRLVNRVVSSTKESFRLASNKVIYIGQGIDVSLFSVRPRTSNSRFHLITVSRLAPSKRLEHLLSSLANWETSIDWHLTIVGEGTTEGECHYGELLRLKAKALLGERVAFTGRLDPKSIADLLAKADAFVNLSSTGSLDKAIVEAMACGCPVISSNDAFREIALRAGFPECAIDNSERALHWALDRLASMSPAERQDLGLRQAEIARRDHSLDGLIEKLYRILAECACEKS